jgi:uncharacterized protein YwgA
MTTALEVPWDRYALIAALAKRLDGVSPQFGKTALQKMVFLLEEAFGLSVGYDFTLYSYGPFDSQLLGDLDQVEHFGCVSVVSAGHDTPGYLIRPTDKVGALEKKAEAFLGADKTKKALNSLVATYGRLNARELELRATIVYVVRDFHRKGKGATKGSVCHLVQQIKPKYPPFEIEHAVEELRGNGHIALAA